MAKFRTADGRELRIPVGDYSDPHHSSCFRAFNMNREIETHQYIPRLPTPCVTPTAPVWGYGGSSVLEYWVEPPTERLQ